MNLKRWKERARNIKRSFKDNWRLFKESKTGVFGLFIILFFVFVAIFSPFMGLRDPIAWRAPEEDTIESYLAWPPIDLKQINEFKGMDLNSQAPVAFRMEGVGANAFASRLFVAASDRLVAMTPRKPPQVVYSLALSSNITTDILVVNYGEDFGKLYENYYVYVGTSDGHFYSINDTEALNPGDTPSTIIDWQLDSEITSISVYNTEKVHWRSSSDMVYVGTKGGHLYGFSALQHMPKWKMSLDGEVHMTSYPFVGAYPLYSPSLTRDGNNLAVGTGNGTMYAISMVPSWSPISNAIEVTTEPIDVIPPSPVTLSGNITSTNVELNWTAPGDDGDTGNAAQYDIRYVTGASCSLTESSWGTATQVKGVPTPSANGTLQSFTVSGLAKNTTHCFGIKAGDEVPNWSGIISSSQIFTGTTNATDDWAPGQVALTAGNVTSNSVELKWTASGDDGWIGRAEQYELRYRTGAGCVIDVSNWNTSQYVSGLSLPQVPGTPESVKVSGLVYSETYCFGLNVSDDMPGWFSLSTVAVVTDPVDSTPPSAVGDMAILNSTTNVILTWTAPGDDGGAGTAARYDIRYTKGDGCSLTDWANATQITGLPSPQSAGATENTTIMGLPADTTICMGLKAADEVPNWSDISTPSITFKTDPIDNSPPDQITNLNNTTTTSVSVKLTWNATGDDGAIGTASNYEIRYSNSTSAGCPLTTLNWERASSATGLPAPLAAGAGQSFTIKSLSPNTTYCFAIKAADEPRGTIGWNFTLGNTWSTSPVVNIEGIEDIVYAASNDGWIYAMYVNNGSEIRSWKDLSTKHGSPPRPAILLFKGNTSVEEGTLSIPLVYWSQGNDTNIYVGSESGYLYKVARDPSGKPTDPKFRPAGTVLTLFKDNSVTTEKSSFTVQPVFYPMRKGSPKYVFAIETLDGGTPADPSDDTGTLFALSTNLTISWKVSEHQGNSIAVINGPAMSELSSLGGSDNVWFVTSDAVVFAYEARGSYKAPLPPSWVEPVKSGRTYWLGTDLFGHDVLSQVAFGTRTALLVGLLAAFFSILIGVIVGIVSGYFGGKIDAVLMRFTDIMIVIPGLPFLIVLAAVLGPSIWNLILIISIMGWGGTARVVRSDVLSLKERPFIESAKVTGASSGRIMFKHIAPNILPLAFLYMTFAVSGAILSEAALSFMGLGDFTAPSWGIMLYYINQTNGLAYWWWLLPPGFCITFLCLGFFLVGRAFEQIVNPRLRRR